MGAVSQRGVGVQVGPQAPLNTLDSSNLGEYEEASRM